MDPSPDDDRPEILPLTIDDRAWEKLWEHTIGPAERHAIVRDAWRRRLPDGEPFEARLTVELAYRARHRARTLGVVYGLWTLFWGAIWWAMLDDGEPAEPVVVGCTVAGLIAVTGCVAARRWLGGLAALRPPPDRPGGP